MPTLDEVTAVVDRWFAERIACGQIAQHTPAYNQAFMAKGDLKAQLAGLFGESQPDAAPEPQHPAAAVEPDPQPDPQPAAVAASDQE